MTTVPAPQQAGEKGFRVPWVGLTIALTILTITALGTLAVVVKKEATDTLSTIALALAILSFSAQLIIVLAQAYNGLLQTSQADRVNADTIASLAEIRATSNALLSTQTEQFGTVLHAALKIAIPAAVEDVTPVENGEDSDDMIIDKAARNLEERLFIRLNEALAEGSSPSSFIKNSPSSVSVRDSSGPSPLYERLRTYPDEDHGKELLKLLDSLPGRDATAFGRIATHIFDRAREGGPSWVTFLYDPERLSSTDRLVAKDLIVAPETSRNKEGIRRRRISLTDRGVEVASLFLGQGNTPEWLKSAADDK
jgi:hypothetical protein